MRAGTVLGTPPRRTQEVVAPMPDQATCSLCSKPAIRRGWCSGHYQRWRKWGDPNQRGNGQWLSPRERFFRFVAKNPETGCWDWQSPKPNGYGEFGIGQKRIVAHRWLYEQERGPVPKGLVLDHLCHNRACVNPDHLEPVTTLENNRRSECFSTINARKTHCPQGHPYSGDNLHVSTKGGRVCRTCSRTHSRKHYHMLRSSQP